MTAEIPAISPDHLHDIQRGGHRPAVLDVRTVAEYRAGHIPGAQLAPIEELVPEVLQHRFQRPGVGHEEPLYITCQTGPRARRAAEKLSLAGYSNLLLVEGGTQGWERAGLPLLRCGKAVSVERQAQIAIGSLLLVKVLLGFSVHELFFALTAIVGAGLIVTGVTRCCGMAQLMARMPWNRRPNCPEQTSA
jgi:rhodanese-related sulfurtransferase